MVHSMGKAAIEDGRWGGGFHSHFICITTTENRKQLATGYGPLVRSLDLLMEGRGAEDEWPCVTVFLIQLEIRFPPLPLTLPLSHKIK